MESCSPQVAGSEVQAISGRIGKTDSVQLLPRQLGELLRGSVFGHAVEVTVDETVWVSLTTNASKSTVEESCGFEHLPDRRVAPIVWDCLREDLDFEVVVSASEHSWRGEGLVDVHADHVLSRLFESVVECLLVLFRFTLAIRNDSISVAHKDQDTSRIGPVEGGDIRYRIGVDEDESELRRVEDFISAWLEVSVDVGPKVGEIRHPSFLTDVHGRSVLHSLIEGRPCLEVSHFGVVVLQVFPSSELLHHYHLVLSHFGSDLKKAFFLALLSEVNNAAPSLFILCLEVLEEFIERFVLVRHLSYTLVERFALFSLIGFHKILKLLNFLNSSRSCMIQ